MMHEGEPPSTLVDRLESDHNHSRPGRDAGIGADIMHKGRKKRESWNTTPTSIKKRNHSAGTRTSSEIF
jgi:hypothetical protein